LVALSAQNSLKRSRMLYATNPQSAFIPSTDGLIYQNSIRRRSTRRRLTTQNRSQQGSSASSHTLAVFNPDNNQADDNVLQMKPISSATDSTALTVHGNHTETRNQKKKMSNGGGILVVSVFRTE
jgi:hypothetical protein